jgi:hypothetical protein
MKFIQGSPGERCVGHEKATLLSLSSRGYAESGNQCLLILTFAKTLSRNSLRAEEIRDQESEVITGCFISRASRASREMLRIFRSRCGNAISIPASAKRRATVSRIAV